MPKKFESYRLHTIYVVLFSREAVMSKKGCHGNRQSKLITYCMQLDRCKLDCITII